MTNIGVLLLLLTFLGYASADPSFVLNAKRTPVPPAIDGVIEEIWLDAASANNFIQYEPDRGKLSETPSWARVLYDSEWLYISFSLHDPAPPTAQLTRRDADLFNDDAVILILDTYHDRRSAYYFMTNLLATQSDGRIGDDGRTVDDTWDAPWQSAARQTETGWTVEISIPFTSLKYAAGDSVTWGINFGRSRRRNLEVSFWAGPLDSQFRVSQMGTLSGLNITPAEDHWQIIPYGLSQFQEDQPTRLDAGIDFRYTLTAEMSAYATVNPDFATIEADQEQVNLTRFELSLPEKRQFFIEGNELFEQRIRTFYSRRIPDITVGGKLLGKLGPWTLAGLATRSEMVDDSTHATYAVARAQRDILGSSNISFMMANCTMQGINQGSASMDATLFFTKTLGMTAQLVKSYGQFDDDRWAYFIRPAYDSPTTHFHIRYTHLGENVGENINAVGFIKDDDRREIDSAFDQTFWFKRGLMERTQYNSNYNIFWGQDGTLRSWQIEQSIEVDLRNRLNCEVDYTEEFIRFEKGFRNRQIGIDIGYNTREFQSVKLGFEFGRNFDSDFQLLSAEAGCKVTTQLSLEYEMEYLTLNPDPESESTWIQVVKANQFFTRDLYLRLFFQTSSVIDRKNLQVVFVYRYQPPFGTIQLAYQIGTAGFGQRSEQGNTLFLKLTYVF